MYKYLILSICFLFATACEDSAAVTLQKEEDAKWKAVIANHDVVMPMMSTTNKVRKNLKNLIAEKENLPTETTEKVNTLIQNLEDADEGMMDWMNGFQQLEKLQKNKNHKEIIQYLEEQDGIIKNVGKTMTNSIKKGMDFIESFEQVQQ